MVVDSPDALTSLLGGPEAELDAWPRCRPMHFTSGTTGRPKGVWSGLLSPDDAEALVARGARPLGISARRRRPRRLADLPLRSPAVRDGNAARRRIGRRAAALRAGVVRGRRARGASDVDVLRAGAPAAPVRVARRDRNGVRPVLVPSRRPCRGSLPGRRSGAAPTSSSASTSSGSSTAPPRASSRPALHRCGWSTRARSDRPGPGASSRPTTTISCGAPCRRGPRSRTGATPRRPPRRGRTPPTAPRSRWATSDASRTAWCGSTRVEATSSSPAASTSTRPRSRPPSPTPRAWTTSPSSVVPTNGGASVCAPPTWARSTSRRCAISRTSAWHRPSDPRSTSASTSCPAPRPARCAGRSSRSI